MRDGAVGRRMPVRTAAGALLACFLGWGSMPLHGQTDTTVAVDTVMLPEDGGAASMSSMAAVPARRGWLGDAPASPLLPPDHWAVRAAARAEALGLADNYLPAQRAVPRAVVFAVLEHAAALGAERPGIGRVSAGWLARFREEFPEYGEDAGGDALVVPLSGHAAAGFANEEGRLSPAIGYFVGVRKDPEPVPAISTPRLDLALGTGDGRRTAAWVLGRWDERGVDVARWEAAVTAGPVALSVGKQPVAYGWGEGGSIVLSETVVPRVEAQTLRPVRLPSVLRVFGGVTLHTFMTPLGGRRHLDEPWLWGARLAFQPHRRLTFAVNRASIFGGETGVTAERLAGMFVGVIRGTSFENQVLGLEARWRLPTDALLPATAYLEWGADDGAGALHEVPAQVAGIQLPALPGLPEVSAGAEYARFKPMCCGHGPWYFNATHLGNWARGTRPLGHPLGGEGWEAAGYARAELMDARLRMHLRGFVRHYSDESLPVFGGGNLYAPARVGRGTGFQAEAAYRFRPHAEIRAAARREAGDDWREHALDAAVSVFF
ncbi:MAG TPA: capsule assembly Wzi family protein [Longimicrobium sp.]|nr:capsule assembly Wzi family protein [Longimicrobium sp.]